MSLRRWPVAFMAVGGALGVCHPDAMAGPPRIGVVALSGQSVPSAPVGVVFANSMQSPQINDAGDVLFAARISGPSVNGNSDSGLWILRSGELALLVREGDPVPGQPGGTVFGPAGTADSYLLDDSGAVFVNGAVGTSQTMLGAMFAIRGPRFDVLSFYGQVVPGYPGNLWRGPTSFVASGGRISAAFRLFTPVSYPADTCLALAGTEMSPALFGGTAAPGFTSGWTVAEMNSVGLGPQGEWALNANVRNGTQLSGLILYANTTSAPRVLVRNGDRAPPDVPADVYINLYAPFVSRSGIVSFMADTRGGKALFQGRLGALTRLVSSRPMTIDLPPAFTASNLIDAHVSVSGELVAATFGLYENVGGVNYYRGPLVAAGNPQVLRVVLSGSMPAVGLSRDLTYSRISSVCIADSGQVAVQALAAPTVSGGVQFNGIWATDLDGQLHLIAAETQPFDVSPGDTRTVRSVLLTSEHAGGASNARPLNNTGQLAFGLTFTDGTSGIFIADFAPRCIADFDASGGIDGGDVDAFFASWSAGAADAEVNGDGAVNGEDVGFFFDRWSGGC